MASAVVELNQQTSDSSLASKSTRLHAQITDSIPTDNPTFGQKNIDAAVKCNHFSIRGYVAEVRKRDPKLCDPFSQYVSSDGSKETKHELPPMTVRTFRWWKCDSCVPGPGSSSGTSKEAQKSAEEAEAPLPLREQTSKVDVPRERNTEAISTSIDSNDNKNCDPPTICADLKGKGKAHTEDGQAPQTGCENGFLVDSSSQRILQQTTDGIEARKSAADEVVLCAGNGHIESQHKNHKSDGIQIGPPREHLNREEDNANKTSPMKKQASLEDQIADALTSGIGTEVVGIVDGPSSDSKGHVVPLPDLNEFNVQPSDEDDDENKILVAENNNLVEDDDDYLGAERRKTPKVRLLSELLGLKENHNDTKLKKKSPLSSFPGPAARKSMVSDHQAQPPLNENAKRKRVSSQEEEELQSMEIKSSYNGTKKLRTPPVEISESEDESCEIISAVVSKRRSRLTLDRNPLLEKRIKRTKVDHGACSSMSQQKIIPKSNHENGKSPEKHVSADAITIKPSQCAHSDRVIDLPRKSDTSTHLNETNLVSTKKGKMLQAGKQQTSLIYKNHVPAGECPEKGKEKEAMRKSAEHVRLEPSQYGSAGKGSNHFPDSYITVRNDKSHGFPVKDVFHRLPSPMEPLLDGGVVRKHTENSNVGGTDIAVNTSGAVPFIGGQFDGNRERNTTSKSSSKGKHIWIPEADEKVPLVQHTVMQVSNSITNPKELHKEVRGRIHDIDINSIPTDDKSELGAGDDSHDIPMDIVELMAKNQYERNLSQQKDNHPPTSLASHGKKGVLGNLSSCGLGLDAYLSRQRNQYPYARNGMINGFEDMVSAKQNLSSPFTNLYENPQSFGDRLTENLRDRFRQPQISARSVTPGQGQEHVSAYSAVGVTPNNWNEHIAAQTCLPSSLQAMDSYNRYGACTPRPNIDARGWPSMVASRMPVGITNPENISQGSNVLNKGKFPYQSSTILNFNSGNPVNKNMSFYNPYNGGQGENSAAGVVKQKGPNYPPKPMGSVDLYSNEAMSAMHLLSLMQNNAANMRPPVTLPMDGKLELLRRPPLAPDQQNRQHSSNQGSGPNKVGAPSSRQPLLENNGRSSMQDNSCHPCYPVVPPAHPFGSSFQNDGGFGRNSGFTSPIPLTSRGQRNMETLYFAPSLGEQLAQNPAFRDNMSRKRPLASFLDKGKGIGGTSSPSSTNPSLATKDSSPNHPYGHGTRREKTIRPSPQKEVCVLNRNPSEFNDLKELSRYTIGPEDLRPRGKVSQKSARPRGNAKRQDMRINKPIPGGKDSDRQRKC